MTGKERVLAVVHNQPYDQIPFDGTGAGGWITNREKLSYRDLYFGLPDSGASLVVDYFNEFGSDTVAGAMGVFTSFLSAFGCPLDIEKMGAPAEVGKCINDPETDIDPLMELGPDDIREKLINNEFVDRMLNMVRHVKKLTGDEKLLMGDVAGPFTSASVLAGTVPFLKMLKKKPERVQQLIDFSVEASAQMLRLLFEAGCDIAMISDPTASGTMIPPKMVDLYVSPSIAALVKKIDYYPVNGVHICGESESRLVPMRDAGVQMFSCDYCTELGNAITVGGETMKINGNINPVGKLLSGTPDEVYEECVERIKSAGGRGFILAPGCDIGFQSSLENIQAMRRACDDMAGKS